MAPKSLYMHGDNESGMYMNECAFDTYIAAPVPPRYNAPSVGPKFGRTTAGTGVGIDDIVRKRDTLIRPSYIREAETRSIRCY